MGALILYALTAGWFVFNMFLLYAITGTGRPSTNLLFRILLGALFIAGGVFNAVTAPETENQIMAFIGGVLLSVQALFIGFILIVVAMWVITALWAVGDFFYDSLRPKRKAI